MSKQRKSRQDSIFCKFVQIAPHEIFAPQTMSVASATIIMHGLDSKKGLVDFGQWISVQSVSEFWSVQSVVSSLHIADVGSDPMRRDDCALLTCTRSSF